MPRLSTFKIQGMQFCYICKDIVKDMTTVVAKSETSVEVNVLQDPAAVKETGG